MKTIKIGNKEYKYDCNAYTYILFKKVFIDQFLMI
jgi:hypothetical protein